MRRVSSVTWPHFEGVRAGVGVPHVRPHPPYPRDQSVDATTRVAGSRAMTPALPPRTRMEASSQVSGILTASRSRCAGRPGPGGAHSWPDGPQARATASIVRLKDGGWPMHVPISGCSVAMSWGAEGPEAARGPGGQDPGRIHRCVRHPRYPRATLARTPRSPMECRSDAPRDGISLSGEQGSWTLGIRARLLIERLIKTQVLLIPTPTCQPPGGR
jgi:hypothetical protein